jgi:hypothetical protein
MKRIQFTTRYKGGGTVESIPEWARPYMENVAKTAEGAYQSGDLGKVAGTSALQNQAFGQGGETLSQGLGATSGIMSSGIGFKGGEQLKQGATFQAGKDIAGLNTQYGSAGTLGSARQANANAGVQADLAAKFANIDYQIAKDDAQAKLAAANAASGLTSTMANLGGQQRTIEQQGLDADWQALNRYASTIYGLPAKQQATSGGK